MVLCEPYGAEMAPAELSYDGIATVREGVADVYRVVTALAVVFPVLLVFGHDGVRRRAERLV